MKKWNKKQFFLSSLVLFLPMIAGFLLWDQLPDRLITHWNAAGEADGSMGKTAAIVVIPAFIFLMHLFCLFMTHLDFSNKDQSPKALLIAYWAMPATSLFAGFMVLGNAAGTAVRPTALMNAFLGVLFIFMGNYMPKCTQNKVLGIRLPWTLKSEENWRKTHRLAGRLWIAGGFMLILCAFLKDPLQMPLLLVILLILCAVPAVYSYKLHKKEQRP